MNGLMEPNQFTVVGDATLTPSSKQPAGYFSGFITIDYSNLEDDKFQLRIPILAHILKGALQVRYYAPASFLLRPRLQARISICGSLPLYRALGDPHMPRSPPFYDFLQFPGLDSAFYIGEPPFEKASHTITVENQFEAGVMITDIVVPKELGSMFWVSVRPPNY